jgi:hypothetical protein
MPVIASIVAGLGQTAVSVLDASKKRQLETNLALLDNRQKNDLAKALASTEDKNRKMEILSSALLTINATKTNAVVQAKTQRERTLAIAVIGGAVVLLIALIILKKKS